MARQNHNRHQKTVRGVRVRSRRHRMLIPFLALVALVTVGALVALTRLGDDDAPVAGFGVDAPVTWTAEPFTGGPRLAIDRTVVDHGAVKYGQKVAATWRLKNVGDAPVQIGNPTVNVLEGC